MQSLPALPVRPFLLLSPQSASHHALCSMCCARFLLKLQLGPWYLGLHLLRHLLLSPCLALFRLWP